MTAKCIEYFYQSFFVKFFLNAPQKRQSNDPLSGSSHSRLCVQVVQIFVRYDAVQNANTHLKCLIETEK